MTTNPSGAAERLTALGGELVVVHDGLREELARLRAGVAGGRRRERGLREHCAAFCGALTEHHTGEDAVMFPELAREYPELRPVLEQLTEDHRMISGLVEALEQVLAGVGDEPGEEEVARVRSRLDGLGAIMESHFAFEERRIVTALNGLRGPRGPRG
ncbi:hemerythrin domain-containing protein [Kitasatospora sp. NPDC096147]|uniref:hemerythrin domain-containing protein n=1 Tax=Kitasatospora sp. NPDC096147 TaxID=3364093 RepID=UPI0037F3DF06